MILNLDNGNFVRITILKNDKGVYEYYTDGVLIGVYNPNVMKDSKFLEVSLERVNTLENELSSESKDEIKQIINEIKQKINDVDFEQIEEEAKENEAIKQYLEENEQEDEEQIKSITTVDLEREVEQKEEKNKDEKEQKDEIEDEELEESKETHIQKKDVNIKQEVDLSERATDMETLRKWLGGNIPKEFQKVGVVESSEMSKMRNENGEIIDNPTTRYGLVLIGKNGQVEPLKKYLPQLEQNKAVGNNPMQRDYQINTDGTVERDSVISEYRIGNKILQLDKDHLDDLEMNIGKYGPFTNNLVTTRMRDSNTQFVTDIDVRRAAQGHYKGVNESENSYKEAQEHEKAGCTLDKLTYKEIDGDPTTGHTHFTEQEMQLYVKELMQNPKINEVFTEKEVEVRLEKNLINKTKQEKSIEEIKKTTENELEEDASHFPTRGERQ